MPGLLVPLEPIGLSPPGVLPPQAHEGFVAACEAAAWKVHAEWVPGFTDDGGQAAGQFWVVIVHREEVYSNGEVLHFAFDVGEQVYQTGYPALWARFLRLAESEWERFRGQHLGTGLRPGEERE